MSDHLHCLHVLSYKSRGSVSATELKIYLQRKDYHILNNGSVSILRQMFCHMAPSPDIDGIFNGMDCSSPRFIRVSDRIAGRRFF